MAWDSEIKKSERAESASAIAEASRPSTRKVSAVERRLHGALVFFFAVFIALPLLGALFGWQSGLTELDMRAPAPRPDFARPVSAWAAQIDAFYADILGFRRYLIRLDKTIRHRLLRASSADVLLGRSGWLFLRQDKTLEDFFGLRPASRDELVQMKNYFEARRNYLAQRGIHYLYIVAPDKESIYPEMLPGDLGTRQGRSRLDQLRTLVRRSSTFRLLDLREVLLGGKKLQPTYFAEDTHWNGFGNYLAYRETLNRFQRWFPDLVPLELGRDYILAEGFWAPGERMVLGFPFDRKEKNGLLLKEHGQFAAQPVPVTLPFNYDGLIPPVKTVNPSAKRKLLITHDSFYRAGLANEARVPFAENFGETLSVGLLDNEQFEKLVNQEHPDVVLEERVQRYVR